MTQTKYVLKYKKVSDNCQRCGEPLLSGDMIVSRSRYRKGAWRGSGHGATRKYYHEKCWEKLFL